MLKKTAAILILAIFTFNWFGYRVYTSILQYMATASLEHRLDSDSYSDSELISIKLPANLPYYANSPEFERVNGEMTIEGVHYNFVKRRLFNDSLEYLCIPNDQKTKLSHARDRFYKKLNDLHHPSQSEKAGSNSSVAKYLLAEYCEQPASTYYHHSYFTILPEQAPCFAVALLEPALSCPAQPPEPQYSVRDVM